MFSTTRLSSLAAITVITAAGAAVPSVASATPSAPAVQLSQAAPQPSPIGLLLPAVQKVREAAAARS